MTPADALKFYETLRAEYPDLPAPGLVADDGVSADLLPDGTNVLLSLSVRKVVSREVLKAALEAAGQEVH